MKKLIIPIVVVFVFYNLGMFAQVLTPKWESCYGGTEMDEGTNLIFYDNSYHIVSRTNSNDGDIAFSHGSYDIWYLNIDTNGNLSNEKTFGGSNPDGGFTQIEELNNTALYIGGVSMSTDGDISNNPWPGVNGNLWVLQINKQGDILWETMAGGNGTDELRDMQVTTDGGVLLLALTSSQDGDITDHHGSWDLWMIEIDSSGQKQWGKSFGGAGFEVGGSLIQTSDGGYVLVGATDGSGGGNYDTTCNHHNPDSGFTDAWVIKLDTERNIEWQQCYGGTFPDHAANVLELSDGYIVLGSTMSNDGDVSGLNGPPGPNSEYGGDIWVFKIDKAGNLIWQNCLGGSYNDFARNIFTTSDGGFMIVGSTASNDGDVEGYHGIDTGIYDDVWFAKLDSLGNLTYQYCYGGGGRETIYRGVIQKDDFNYVITLGTDTDEWQCSGANNWKPDLRVVELYDSTIGINEITANIPVVKIYPNPANSLLNIDFQNDYNIQNTIIEIVDINGRIMLKSKPLSSLTRFDISKFNNGLYLIKIQNDKTLITRKIIIQ